MYLEYDVVTSTLVEIVFIFHKWKEYGSLSVHWCARATGMEIILF